MAKLKSQTRIFGTADVDSVLTVGLITPSAASSTTSGSLQVSGGVGITGTAYIGNDLNVLNNGYFSQRVGIANVSPTEALDVTGNIKVSGGITAGNGSVISANSAGDALRITQTGTGNALVVEDSDNPDSSPFIVTGAGNVGINNSSPSYQLDVAGTLGVSGHVTIEGVTSTGATGTGKFVFDTSPSITSPTITSPQILTSVLVGPTASANLTRFPNALAVVSKTDAGIQQNEPLNIGLIAEATGSGSTYGSGLYGVGYTAGAARGTGVTGEGHVSATGDSASAIGVRGYSIDTHASGLNVGLLADASGSSIGNYALYISSGDINTSTTSLIWLLRDNQASALSFDAPGKTGILVVKTTDAGEGVSMSGTLSVTGHVTLEGVTSTGATGTGKFVFDTSPTIAGGSHTGITSLGIRDTSAAFDVTIAATSSTALTAARTLTVDMVNAARTVKLAGNIDIAGTLTTANTFSTSGNFALTLTTTAATNATLPSGTVTLAANNQTMYIGTTSVAINRTTGALALTGITSIDGYAAGLAGGNNTTLLGSIPYQSNTNVTTLLAPNTTANKRFLRMTGTGTNGAAPAWDTVTATDVGLGNVTNESKATMFTSPTFTGTVNMPTGTASVPPMDFIAGTVTTVPVAGSIEYDGSTFFATENTTTGRGAIDIRQSFHLSANGAAFGPTVGNFFGANSAINLEANSTYEIKCFCYFLKTTAGTLTWAPTVSSAAALIRASYQSTAITGFTTTILNTADVFAAATIGTATAATFAATGSLTTAVNHVFEFEIRIRTTLACNFRMNVTQSAGTVTPLAGSHYVLSKINSTTGSFAA